MQHGDFVFCIKYLKHKEALEAVSIRFPHLAITSATFFKCGMAWWRIICAISAGIASHGSPSEASNHPRGEPSLLFTNVVGKPTTPRSSKKAEFESESTRMTRIIGLSCMPWYCMRSERGENRRLLKLNWAWDRDGDACQMRTRPLSALAEALSINLNLNIKYNGAVVCRGTSYRINTFLGARWLDRLSGRLRLTFLTSWDIGAKSQARGSARLNQTLRIIDPKTSNTQHLDCSPDAKPPAKKQNLGRKVGNSSHSRGPH